uniref:Putative secreted protein n=1 Tax=Anopheles darlingi TaxID=43151 RepID=A0A2M4DP79_ANODA
MHVPFTHFSSVLLVFCNTFCITIGMPLKYVFACACVCVAFPLRPIVELERNSLQRSSMMSSAAAALRTTPPSLIGRSNLAAVSGADQPKVASNDSSSSSRRSNTGSNSFKRLSSDDSGFKTTTGATGASDMKGSEPAATEDQTAVKRIVAGKRITAMFEEKLVEGLQKASRKPMYRESTAYKEEDTVDV